MNTYTSVHIVSGVKVDRFKVDENTYVLKITVTSSKEKDNSIFELSLFSEEELSIFV